MTGSSRSCVGAGASIIAMRPTTPGYNYGKLPGLLAESAIGIATSAVKYSSSEIIQQQQQDILEAMIATKTAPSPSPPPEAMIPTKSAPASASPPPPSKAFRNLRAGESVQDFYELGEQIVETGSGTVLHHAVRRSDGHVYVVKSQCKKRLGRDVREWRNLMSRLLTLSDAPHVLEIEEVFEDATHMHVVAPRCEGGDLWQLVGENEAPLRESEVRAIIRQLLLGLEKLHKHQLIHQDIKPDNVMLDYPRRRHNNEPLSSAVPATLLEPAVSIIDFDLCEAWMPGKGKVTHFSGTPGFVAPEALMGEASPQSDLWAVGALLYTLITGEVLWPDLAEQVANVMDEEDCAAGCPGAERVYRAMRVRRPNTDSGPWHSLHLARDLCQKLLAFNPKERPWSAAQALRHRWLDFPLEDHVIMRGGRGNCN